MLNHNDRGSGNNPIDLCSGIGLTTPALQIADDTKFYFRLASLFSEEVPRSFDAAPDPVDLTEMVMPILQGGSPVAAATNVFAGPIVGDLAIFVANDGMNGPSLWASNGTLAGTTRILDLAPGNASASVSNYRAFRNQLLFTFDDGVNGTSLWITNGTAGGTHIVKDIIPGSSASPGISGLTIFRDQVVFTANDGASGTELWVTDGTEAGTHLFGDFLPGTASFFPSGYAVAGAQLFFVATTPATGSELWVTDGSVAGTHMVTEIRAGTTGGTINSITALGSNIVFSADDGVNGRELWISDGSAAGTRMLFNINPGAGASFPGGFTAFGNRILFSANTAAEGFELWVTDGTAAGTALLKDIRTGTGSGSPSGFVVSGSKVFFVANNGLGSELWVTDGTTAGTVLVKDIWAGTSSSAPNGITALGDGRVVFGANGFTVGGGRELWISDGTAAGTTLLKDINTNASDPLNFVAINGNVLFTATDDNNGNELWITDGTTVGTQLVNIPDTRTYDGGVRSLTALGGKLIFSANSATTGYELFISDGTSAGTVLLKDIVAGTDSSLPGDYGMTQLGSRLLFVLGSYVTGQDLYATDGTAGGTVLLKDVAAADYVTLRGTVGSLEIFTHYIDATSTTNTYVTNGTAGGTTLLRSNFSISYALAVGMKSVFAGYDTTNGNELWVTDGTNVGTVLLKSLEPGSASSYPNLIATLGSKAVFTATTSATGTELWVTDGTAVGTVMLKDINPGTPSSLDQFGSSQFRTVGSRIFFVANDGTHGNELWVTDGTAAGTVLAADVVPGAGGPSDFGFRAAFNGKLLFNATTIDAGRELWISDGTPAGTFMLRDIKPGAPSGSPGEIALLGASKFVFTATGPEGAELWISDGTAAGTQLLTDLVPGSVGSEPGWLTPFGNKILFRATTAAAGDELWITDGTAAGTVMLKDINPGTPDSNAQQFTVIGTKAYFGADNGTNGYELWVTDGTTAGTVQVKDILTTAVGSTPTSATSFSLINVAPQGIDSALTIAEDQFYTLRLLDFGYADRDGHAIASITIVTVPTAGSLLFDADGAGGAAPVAVTAGQVIAGADIAAGKLTFQGGAEASGPAYATLTFRIRDAGGTANGGSDTDLTPNTLTINVAAVDDLAIARPDAFATSENASITGGVGALFADHGFGADSDIDGPALAIGSVNGQAANVGVAFTLPSGAVATINADGSYGYNPNGAFDWLISPATAAATGAVNTQALDSFTYTLVGGTSATVSMTINGVDGLGDQLFGSAGDDIMTGTAGDDFFVVTQGGNDRVAAGDGNDAIVVGGTTSTQIDGGAGTDRLVVASSATLGSLAGLEAIDLQNGTALTLSGAQFGTFGIGSAMSGNGSITINLAPGDFQANAQFLTVAAGSTISYTINGSSDSEAIKGSVGASFIIDGGDGSDQIRGGSLVDTIIGGNGDDKLMGARGADVLTGGAGSDVFRYQTVQDSGLGANADRITDFLSGTDKLGFVLLDADPNTPGIDPFGYIDTQAFHANGAAEIRYETSGADIVVQVDANGDGIADMAIYLNGLGGTALSSGDFLI
jgi:ELWxxDGT repeat protein